MLERVEVTFPNGETHGYTFHEQKYYDFFVTDCWEKKGYKIVKAAAKK